MLIERRDRYQGSSSVAVHLGFWDRTSGWYGECSWGRPAGQRVPGTHLSQLFQPWDLSMCLCSGELNSILHTCSANILQTKLTLTPCQKRIIFKSTTDSMLGGERISTERPVTWWWAACAECPYISDRLESRTVSPCRLRWQCLRVCLSRLAIVWCSRCVSRVFLCYGTWPCCTPIISATRQCSDFLLGLEISSELLCFHLTLLTSECRVFPGSGAGFQGNDLPPGSWTQILSFDQKDLCLYWNFEPQCKESCVEGGS